MISLIITLVLLGAGLYVAQLLLNKAPIDGTIKQVIVVILWVVAILYLLRLLVPFLHLRY